MSKKNWLTRFRLDINAPSSDFALMILALTQVHVGIKNAAEVACMGRTSNVILKLENNPSKANMIAVQRCNGRNQLKQCFLIQAK